MTDAPALARRTWRRAGRIEASLGVWLLAALALVFLVVAPLGWLVFTSLQSQDGALTLANYREAFGSSIYLAPILNSLIVAASVATLAVLVGTPLAWLVARSDLPARNVVRVLVVATFVTPSFLGAQAWIVLAAPNSGWLNRAYVALTGAVHGPFDIYTLAGAIFVMALYNIPYTFTFVAGALEAVTAEVEDAASILGASPLRTMLQITLPLAAPAILAGFILSFLEALAEFGAPAFLLIPARQQVITTQLYEFFQFPVRLELAAAYAMPLLLATVALLALRRWILARKRFTTIGGKGGRARVVRLGKARPAALAFACTPLLLAVVLPYGALLASSLSRAWGQGPVPGNLTLHWYRWALVDNAATQAAVIHSFSYAALAATVAVTVGALIAYAVTRRLTAFAQLLGFIAMAPFVVPGIVLSIGFFAAYSHRPLLLYGSGAMLTVAFAARFLPIAYSCMGAMLQGLSPDLESAARTLGAGQLHTLSRITLPLLHRGLLAGWLLVFIPALRELSSAIFLFTPGTATMTTVIFDLSDAGNFEAVATMGVLILSMTLAVVALAYHFVGRDFLRTESIAP